MMWSKLVSWVITRGVVSGAVFGALLGAFVCASYGTITTVIYGATIGFVLGAIIGAALGFINGILLAEVTVHLYAPPTDPSIYPKVIYAVAVFTNVLPFLFLLGGFGAIPALVTGFAALYFAGGFLEYADSLMAQLALRNTPVNVLS